MESLTTGRDGDRWFAEPLVDAGLDLDEISLLVSRLAHVAMTCGPGLDAELRRLVADQPPHVRAAWLHMIDRMIWWSDRLG